MIGYILRIIRVANDLSIRELAEAIGFSSAYISEIERGKKTPTIESLKRFAEYYKFPVSYVFVLDELRESLGLSYQRLLYFTLAYYLYNFELEKINGDNLTEKIEEVKELSRRDRLSA